MRCAIQGLPHCGNLHCGKLVKLMRLRIHFSNGQPACERPPQRQRLTSRNSPRPVRCTPPFSSRLRDFHSFPSFTISCSWAASPSRVAGARPRRPLEGLGTVEDTSGGLGTRMGLNPFAQAFIPTRISPRPQASASGALPASTSSKTAGATADAAEAPVFPLLGLPREVRAGSPRARHCVSRTARAAPDSPPCLTGEQFKGDSDRGKCSSATCSDLHPLRCLSWPPQVVTAVISFLSSPRDLSNCIIASKVLATHVAEAELCLDLGTKYSNVGSVEETALKTRTLAGLRKYYTSRSPSNDCASLAGRRLAFAARVAKPHPASFPDLPSVLARRPTGPCLSSPCHFIFPQLPLVTT